HIGGDYFDIIELDANRFFVAVGDVSGKGLPASLYMARVQTLVQAECRIQDNPRDVLIAVNKKLIGSMEKKTFITMSLALFDLTKNSMSFCRAGHIPLLIKSHGIVREIKTPGIGLGLDKGAIFERSLQQDEFALEKGQVYVFMSDGINEAMDLDKECIGTEEIVKVISESNGSASEIMAEATWERIAVFKKSAEPNDDMTLVILRILS
ncbi:MAG: serine/threonine-protein phosphatase, partial [Ignavibacteriales bacterium]|nr:serine/threonine-protein phosphatase [Ignavibacteriales bacterium]